MRRCATSIEINDMTVLKAKERGNVWMKETHCPMQEMQRCELAGGMVSGEWSRFGGNEAIDNNRMEASLLKSVKLGGKGPRLTCTPASPPPLRCRADMAGCSTRWVYIYN